MMKHIYQPKENPNPGYVPPHGKGTSVHPPLYNPENWAAARKARECPPCAKLPLLFCEELRKRNVPDSDILAALNAAVERLLEGGGNDGQP